jgi:c-di-GMP-related signal transduction protein
VTSAPSAPPADSALPDVFVARQPIFDAQLKLFGYEMLFRASRENRFTSSDQEQASLSVIANSFFVFGIGTLAGEARAFINFTRETLLNEYAYALPRNCLVVEILEDVKPDAEVVAACSRLKERGYMLALDDFDQRAEHEDIGALLDLVDVVKIDFAACDNDRRAKFAHELLPRGINLLAEKVETREDRDLALSLGYAYLQGYFFARPEILVRQQAPALRAHRMEIIRELHCENPNLRKVEDLFKHDPDLSYKLLRHLNSAAFSFRSRIDTIWRAITILGERGMRAWASVVVLAGLGGDHLSEVIVTSVTRARFCELIGKELKMGAQTEDLFMMGLFSLIDVLMKCPMEEAIGVLPLSSEAQDALLDKANRFKKVLDLTRMFERGQWYAADQLIWSLGLSSDRIQSLYLDAVQWGNQSRELR